MPIRVLLCTGTFEVNPAKNRKKDGDKRACSGCIERCTTIGLRISGHRAAGIFTDFTEEPKSLGTNSTSAIHKSRTVSRKHLRK